MVMINLAYECNIEARVEINTDGTLCISGATVISTEELTILRQDFDMVVGQIDTLSKKFRHTFSTDSNPLREKDICSHCGLNKLHGIHNESPF